MYLEQPLKKLYKEIHSETLYRHTSFYCTLQIQHFLQTEGLWPPCIQQVYWPHFSNSICSLHVSVSHFGNYYNISNFSLLLYLLWWSVISNFHYYYCRKTITWWRLRRWLAFFTTEVILKVRYVHCFFRHYAIDYSIV